MSRIFIFWILSEFSALGHSGRRCECNYIDCQFSEWLRWFAGGIAARRNKPVTDEPPWNRTRHAVLFHLRPIMKNRASAASPANTSVVLLIEVVTVVVPA